MESNFWKSLYLLKKGKEPIIALAPMADVTDFVFRNLVAEKSEFGTQNSFLDVLWTEFVSVNGLNDNKGRKVLIKNLRYDSKSERPIVAQIFGNKVEGFASTTQLLIDLGFDGIDINMGCPDTNVNSQGSGAYMIKVPELAKQIAMEVKKVIIENESLNKIIPLSIKTRIGYNKIEWQTWLAEILQVKPQTITLHLRTKKELSLVPSHWELAPEIVKWIRRNFGYPENGGPIIILNGDVKNYEEAKIRWQECGCDGIMIGRGIFGNPWLFNRNLKKRKEHLSRVEILETLVEHSKRFEKEMNFKSFSIMKKHFKAYVNGWDGAKDLRNKLFQCEDSTQVKKVIDNYLFWYKLKNFLKIFY